MAKRSSSLSFSTFRALNRHNSAILAPILKVWPPFCLSWQADSKYIKISRDQKNGGAITSRWKMRVD